MGERTHVSDVNVSARARRRRERIFYEIKCKRDRLRNMHWQMSGFEARGKIKRSFGTDNSI